MQNLVGNELQASDAFAYLSLEPMTHQAAKHTSGLSLKHDFGIDFRYVRSIWIQANNRVCLMLPEVPGLLTLFDSSPLQISCDLSHDFACFKGEISGSSVVMLANQSSNGTGSPMTRLDAVSSILHSAACDHIPIIWVIRGVSHVVSKQLTLPPCYPDFFVGSSGTGSYLRSVFHHSQFATQVAIIDQEVTSSKALALSASDLILMHKESTLTIGRPSAVRSFVQNADGVDAMGTTKVHKEKTGTCALEWSEFREVSIFVKRLLSRSNVAGRVFGECKFEIPSKAETAFDIYELVNYLFDDMDAKLSLWKDYAPEIICELGHVNGQRCGVIANNCLAKGGFLTPEAIKKMKRFLILLEKMRIPFISLVDCAGIYSDPSAEAGGIFDCAAELFSVLSLRKQSHICVVVRRAYSAGLYLMGGGNYSKSKLLALPTAKFAIYGPRILHALERVDEACAFEFARMLELHDEPAQMSEIGGFTIVDVADLKRHLFF